MKATDIETFIQATHERAMHEAQHASHKFAHEIQGVAGVVFEEVIELFGLAVFDTEMHVRDEDAAEMLRHSNI